MDIFIYILATLAAILIVRGACILGNRSLEIGALVGIVWIIPGLGIGLLAAILWCIQHVTLDIA